MSQPFIVFGSPQIQREEIDEVVATLRSGWLGTGPRVATFEKAFAEYKGTTATLPSRTGYRPRPQRYESPQANQRTQSESDCTPS